MGLPYWIMTATYSKDITFMAYDFMFGFPLFGVSDFKWRRCNGNVPVFSDSTVANHS